MAEKGFGVKEINLIGASGTPTITSPNNINLNAANVAISTNVSIGGTMTITGGIDSVGLVTARSGIVVGAGKSINIGSFGSGIGIGATYGHRDISVVGFSTLSGGALVRYGGSYDMEQGPNNSGFRIVDTGSGYKMQLIYTSNNRVQLNTGTAIPLDIDAYNISLLADQSVFLSYNNSTKLQTSNTGVTVTGTLAATAVTGDGSGLTGISVTPTTSDIQVAYELLNTSSSSNGYRISGNGTNSSTNNPDLYLIRGQKYRFINNSGGTHPFRIQSDTSSTLYSTGVTNNNANSGNIDFAPTFDSPSHLYYKCGSHPSMLGNIYISGGDEGRSTTSAATGSIAQAAYADITIPTTGKTFALLKIAISAPAWVILYTDTSSRTSDAAGTGSGRSEGTDPTPGSGVLAEVSTTTSGASTFKMTPGVIGWNDDGTPVAQVYARVYNKRATSGSNAITVTLTSVIMEV